MPKQNLRKTRRKNMRGGEHYSFSGQLAPGIPNWKSGSELEGVDSKHLPKPADLNKTGGKRRRRTYKRTRRGGNKYGTAIGSFTGTGERGLGNYAPLNVRGVAQGGKFNNYGAGPGDFSKFSPYK
jgi:hypothetical protein